MENNVKYRTSLVTTLFDRERGLGRSKIENRRGKGADSVKRRDQTRNKSAPLCRNGVAMRIVEHCLHWSRTRPADYR